MNERDISIYSDIDYDDYGGYGRLFCRVELRIAGKLVSFECDDEETAKLIVSKIVE